SEELFPAAAGPAFDPLTAAHSLAQEIVDGLLFPERLARVASFHSRDRELPSPDEVISKLVSATWRETPDDADVELHLIARRAVLDGLLDLAGKPEAPTLVRSTVELHLKNLRNAIEHDFSAAGSEAGPAVDAQLAAALRDIDLYFGGQDDPSQRPRPAPIPLPWP
ncbi:MAG TPA: hypothetical protein VMN76_03535, partial [Acidobacteriota bacterium]|nr:hypothetical protein [Acidobacteriota bacterium]